MPVLPRNCRRNETHFTATDPLKGSWEGAWRVGVAASQETYLTDKITFPTEGKGVYCEKKREQGSTFMSVMTQ